MVDGGYHRTGNLAEERGGEFVAVNVGRAYGGADDDNVGRSDPWHVRLPSRSDLMDYDMSNLGQVDAFLFRHNIREQRAVEQFFDNALHRGPTRR